MALFNQLTLYNILNSRNNLGTPELRAAVAAMLDEQRDNTLVFLEWNTLDLAGLPDGHGIQAVANAKNFLDYLSTIEPNAGGATQEGLFQNFADRIASTLLPKFENFLGQVKDGFKFF